MNVIWCFIWVLGKALTSKFRMKNPVTLYWILVHIIGRWSQNVSSESPNIDPRLTLVVRGDLNCFDEGKQCWIHTASKVNQIVIQGPRLVHGLFLLWNEVCSSIGSKWAQISIAVSHPKGSLDSYQEVVPHEVSYIQWGAQTCNILRLIC